MVDSVPNLTQEFAEKFRVVKQAKKAYFNAFHEFSEVHKAFFFRDTPNWEDEALFWEYLSPDPKG